MEPRPYQREACESVWEYLCSQTGNPVVVLPTGAGKSVVIAELCRAAVQQYRGRVVVLAHRKELLEQNAEKIKSLLPFGISCGLYSAGLGVRNTSAEIVCGGIQSVFRRAEELGSRQLAIVDEVHLVPRDGDGMYVEFLNRLREINPRLRLVGLTATPYRTKDGSVCRADGLFQKICYEAQIWRLIEDEYLSPLTSCAANATCDTSGLHIRGGEFVATEVEQLFHSHVASACREIAARTRDRKSVLVFCAGVRHAESVGRILTEILDEPCGVVTGDMPPLLRSETLARFRSRQLRLLCNVDVLTTGFDAPCIDAIALLRATCSPGLFVQICGRGFRLYPGKTDCLVLDFGENIKRHGPIDAIDFGRRNRATNGEGDAPTKKCPNCERECHAAARECDDCGWQFAEREIKHEGSADVSNEILSVSQKMLVEEVRFSRHRKKTSHTDKPDSLRVDYLCQPAAGGVAETISEWVCIDHAGFAGRKARQWWSHRSRAVPEADELGSFIDSCIDLFQRGAVASPRMITVVREGPFFRVTNCELDEIPEEWSDDALQADPWEVEQSF